MDAALLNKMLEARVKDLAARRIPSRRSEHEARLPEQKLALAKALGLHPAPPKTDLNAQVTGILHREGYRIEKLRYESRPGLLVTAHLYLPEKEGKFPLILCPHGHWEFKKSTPVVQARCIGLALLGFAALLVDSPGVSWDDNDQNERKAMGTHDDPWLCMGAPVQGQYVWDLVRGLDYCETRPEIDASKVGITGASGGGTATMLAFAFDERISAAAPVCAATSMEINPHNGCFCNHKGGLMEVGDRSDILAIRAPAPVCLIGATEDPEFPLAGHQLCFEKLQKIYRLYKAEANVRREYVEGSHDYNRRMREAMYAFFSEHLKGQPRRSFLAEPRPLTDGQHNPYESGTEPHSSPELLVTLPEDRSTVTFRQLLERTFVEPHPEPFDALKRLAPWAKYGVLDLKASSTEIDLIDAGPDVNAGPNTFILDPKDWDIRLLIYLGLSPAEFFAQVLHMHLPGKPEGWESNALGADAITSMIASVKHIVQGTDKQEAIQVARARGPVSSMVAQHLKLLRPTLAIEVSDSFSGWKDLYDRQMTALIQPNARYLKWPF